MARLRLPWYMYLLCCWLIGRFGGWVHGSFTADQARSFVDPSIHSVVGVDGWIMEWAKSGQSSGQTAHWPDELNE